MYVWVRICCADGSSSYLYIVICGYMCILGDPGFICCCTLWISASYSVFVYGRYRKSRLNCVVLLLKWIWKDGVMYVWVRICCADGSSSYLYIVICGYMCILGDPGFICCCTLWISASYSVFVYGRYRKSRLICVELLDLDFTLHHQLLRGAAPAIKRSAWPAYTKNGKSGREVLTQFAKPIWQLHHL